MRNATTPLLTALALVSRVTRVLDDRFFGRTSAYPLRVYLPLLKRVALASRSYLPLDRLPAMNEHEFVAPVACAPQRTARPVPVASATGDGEPAPSTVEPNEWESTLSVPIDETEFVSVCRPDDPRFADDAIFCFKDDTRLSQRRLQRKVTVERRNVLGYLASRDLCYPIQRTTARETLMPTIECQDVTRCTHRRFYTTDHGVRVAYERICCDRGLMYRVCYEIEYTGQTTYAEILEHEQRLMETAAANGHVAVPTPLELINMFGCVMTKVQPWHCFDEQQPYRWAYKWNGVKSKMIVDAEQRLSYLWPDAGAIYHADFHCRDYDALANVCLLVELLDDRVVIIETIGAQYSDGEVYTTEPQTNVRLLDRLHARLGDDATVDGKPLSVQRYYDAPKPFLYDESLYDGFVIVQNDMVIKWKMPTIDVACVAPYTYQVGDDTILRLPDDEGEVDAIYEMSPDRRIVRRRSDRIAASSQQEWQVFLASVEMLRLQQPERRRNGQSSKRPAAAAGVGATFRGTSVKRAK